MPGTLFQFLFPFILDFGVAAGAAGAVGAAIDDGGGGMEGSCVVQKVETEQKASFQKHINSLMEFKNLSKEWVEWKRKGEDRT